MSVRTNPDKPLASRRQIRKQTILEAINDERLFAPWFQDRWFKKNPQSWSSWFSFLKALFGLPMDAAELATLNHRASR
jgi:hypothetical protein